MAESQVAPDFIPDDQVPSAGPTPSPLPSPQNQDWEGSYGVAMPDFISDEQMAQNESNSSPDFISDADAERLTQSHPVMSTLEAAANKMTLGTLPNLQAQVGSALGLGDYDKLLAENKQRQQLEAQTNPTAHEIGNVLGTAVPLIAMPNIGIASLGKIGSAALDGAIKMGGLESANQFTNYLLGNKTDPSNIAKQAAFGAIGGAFLPIVGKGIGIGSNLFGYGAKNADSLVSSFLTGAGHASMFPAEATVNLENSALSEAEKKLIDPGMFKAGQSIYKNITKKSIINPSKSNGSNWA